MPKLFELMLEVVPRARVLGLLANPDAASTESIIEEMQKAAPVGTVRNFVRG
jgi:ABC-type uncharacterized transport system substrate-binding protein